MKTLITIKQFAADKLTAEKSVTIPVGKISSIQTADDLMMFASYLEGFAKELKDIASPVVIENGGSDNFIVVKESIRSKIDWDAIRKMYKVKDEDIDACTSKSTTKPFC